MGTGQGKLPLDVVTDNALRKRKYEQDELEGAQPLMVSTSSDGEVEFPSLSQLAAAVRNAVQYIVSHAYL